MADRVFRVNRLSIRFEPHLCILQNYIMYVSSLECDVPRPHSKSASGIDCTNPLGQGIALGLVLRAVDPLDLENERHAIPEADNEIRHVAPPRPLPEVVDLEAEVIVLGEGYDFFPRLEDVF